MLELAIILGVAAAAGTAGWRMRTPTVSSSSGLDPLFEFSRRVGRSGELQDVLRSIARAVQQEEGFCAAIVRLYDARTQLYEARAFAGLSDDRIGQISNQDVTARDYTLIAERSLSVSHSHRLVGGGELVDQKLDPNGGDVLLVPLLAEDGASVGYLCAQLDPDVSDATVAAKVQCLEAYAIFAVSAIRNARLHTELDHSRLELSLASEKLKELQRLKENFVATVSHELRTPLTSVKAYAETLSRSLEQMDQATTREFAGIIVNESDRLNEVFDDILDSAQLEQGRLRMSTDDFSLRELAEEMLDEFGPQIEKKSIPFRLRTPSDDVVIHADRSAMVQVLRNLLSNAIKFTPDGGEIRLSLTEDVSMVRVVLEDEGIGIPEEELERVFDRFHQVDNSATRAYGGQGLGLAISRDIVRWHSGRIWAERSRLGGARIVLLMPRKGFVVSAANPDVGDAAERMERQSLLHLLTSLVSETLGARIVSLMLLREDELRIEAAVGLEEEVVRNTCLRVGEGVAGQVARDGRSILIPDLDRDDAFAGRKNEMQYTTRSLLSCPVVHEGEILGVINVNNKVDGTDLDEGDRMLLEALAENVACGLVGFGIFQQGHRRLTEVNEALRAIVDVSRQRRTRLRDELVRCGLETARTLGFDRDEQRALSLVLRVYDLGLSKVSEQILGKVAPLSAEERTLVEEHVRTGAALTAGLRPASQVLRMILHHHENFDGSGYPDGLEGEAIPVGARIVRLVDAIGAALHDHPFRRRLPLDEAIQVLEEGTGRRFCPRVTPVFLEILQGRREELVQLLQRTHVDEESQDTEHAPVLAGTPEE